MFSNSQHIAQVNLGKLRGWKVKKQILKGQGQSVDLVDKYVDKAGKRRYKGNRNLRGSEFLGVCLSWMKFGLYNLDFGFQQTYSLSDTDFKYKAEGS